MRTPAGTEHAFQVHVSAYDTVIVFGITDEQKVLLIKEYFVAAGQHVWSIVAGVVDNNDREATAKKELLEEAGCTAREWVYLGSSCMNKYRTGYTHFYLARGVEQVQDQQLEPTEDIEVFFESIETCKQLLRDGSIHDTPKVACAYRALDYLQLL